MKLSPRERSFLREMGVAWPDGPEPADGAAAHPLGEPSAQAPERAAPASTGARQRTLPPQAPVTASVTASVTAAESAAATSAATPAATAAATAAARAAARADKASPEVSGPWPVLPTWEALQASVASCRRCGLCETRRHTVFGVGHPQAQWMVVGEAPGEHEDRQGEPFVGAAGQLLDRMLASIGLGRGDQAGQGVFITNTVKCRPPQNRNPDPSELAACEPVLHQQMAWVRPRLILAMGRFAAQQLLRSDEPIGRLRGRVHRLSGADVPWAGAQGVPVVVTYHPAYLLRNPIDKAKAWDDLCLALDTMAELGG